jgi:transcriptional regulator with XRE-family HTH domain
MTHTLLATFVQRRRAALNLTVEAAAEHAGVPAEFWRAIESGAFVPPAHHCQLLAEIGHVLDVSSDALSFWACASEYNEDIDFPSAIDGYVACPFSDSHLLQALDVAPSARANINN